MIPCVRMTPLESEVYFSIDRIAVVSWPAPPFFNSRVGPMVLPMTNILACAFSASRLTASDSERAPTFPALMASLRGSEPMIKKPSSPREIVLVPFVAVP